MECSMKAECSPFNPLPVFLAVNGKPCTVIGGGSVAGRKCADLIEAGADITVIAVHADESIVRLAEKGALKLLARKYSPGDLKGAFIVFAATNDNEVNKAVWQEAEEAGIPVNVIDVPALCNFYSGSVLKRGPLQIAISTNGCCPALAKAIRHDLEDRFPADYGDYIAAAGEIRQRILADTNFDSTTKRTLIEYLVQQEYIDLYHASGMEAVWDRLRKISSTS